MQGLAEAVKTLRLTDFFDQGRRAYRLGIERRDNPINSPSGRTHWERGWDTERDSFSALLQRMRS